uniref:Uncharacterized protein n=1 Tax=Anopheles atroparvus TaxID=41427 RepID=A0A182J5M5_ANOAO
MAGENGPDYPAQLETVHLPPPRTALPSGDTVARHLRWKTPIRPVASRGVSCPTLARPDSAVVTGVLCLIVMVLSTAPYANEGTSNWNKLSYLPAGHPVSLETSRTMFEEPGNAGRKPLGLKECFRDNDKDNDNDDDEEDEDGKVHRVNGRTDAKLARLTSSSRGFGPGSLESVTVFIIISIIISIYPSGSSGG